MSDTVAPSTQDQPTGEELPASGHRGRGWSIALAVVASVILLFTALDTWVKRQVLDTNNWVSTSDQLLEDPVVRNALSVYIVDQLYTQVDVAGELQAKLPTDLQGLAGPLAGALRAPATAGVDRLLNTDRVKALWHDVNRAAHQNLVKVLRGESGAALTTDNGNIVLHLRPMVVNVGTTLGLPTALIDKIPEDAGSVTLVQSDQLRVAQDTVQTIDRLSELLFVVVIALYAAAVWVASGWRRKALRTVGWSIAITALVMLVIQRLAGNYVTQTLVTDPANRKVVTAVWAIAIDLLRQIAWTTFAVGIVVVLAAVYAGPSRAAQAVRRFVAPALNARPWSYVAGAGALLLLILLWAPLALMQQWIGLLVFVAVYVGAAVAARRISQHEHPDVRFEGWDALWRSLTHRGESPIAVAAAPAAPAPVITTEGATPDPPDPSTPPPT